MRPAQLRDYESANRTFEARLDWRERYNAGEINCAICPPNKGENASRKPATQSWKNSRKVRWRGL